MRTEIHLFGGQGSNGIFDDVSLAVVKQDARSCRAAQDLVARCHSSLIQDCASLFSEDEATLQVIYSFPTSSSLLSPPVPVQRTPAVGAATLCLYQLLRFLGNAMKEGSYEQLHENIHETLGFSSGILPAVVVAASPDVSSFVEHGVQAFRAAFCIGRRADLYSRKLYKEEGSWAYAINGLSHRDISQRVLEFNENAECPIAVASIIRTTHITISAPKGLLDQFTTQLPGNIQSRPVRVHALYHGGEQMRTAVDDVLEDLENLGIRLPSVTDLVLLVRDSFDGSCLRPTSSPDSTRSNSLSRWATECLLVKPINWPLALSSMSRDIRHSLSSDIKSVRAVAYGPFAPVLTADLPDSSDHSFEKVNVSHENPEVQIAANYEPRESDIAIVGVGLNFPNGSNLDDFWQTLLEGKSFAREVPSDRFSRQQTTAFGNGVPHHGNFVDNPWEFDNALFGISPREAKAMDPQQRLLLQCSYYALENAGYVPDSTRSFQRETLACFVGVATGDYTDRASEEMDVYHSTGTLRAFLSGRLSYYFGLSGPSVVVDTACSSSLVAIHQACQSLIAGECNSALAGGVNVICGAEMQAGLARSHFLSPSGQCRPFDASADGYCRAEGCGIFVLKRLSDALVENDRVLGIIKGTGVNQSGNAHSITHPHDRAQIKLMKRVLQQNGILPQTIGAVEAHGTGTRAGDPVEFTSIMTALDTSRFRSSPLTVSSLKGNIGHAEAASGSAGLIKLLLMVSEGMVPPQAGFRTPNPKIAPLMHEGIRIPLDASVWPRTAGLPRRAILNNFGASGSNACLIIQEHIPLQVVADIPLRDFYVFALSAKDRDAFDRRRMAMIKYLRHDEQPIQNLSYTSLRHVLLETRLVVVVKSTQQLLKMLEDPKVEPLESSRNCGPTKVVLVFSGQGGHHLGMGRELFETTESFREDVLQCDEIIRAIGYPSILPIIQNLEGSVGQETLAQMHCAAFTIQYALTRLWVSWGTSIDAIIGHSLGEYAAFVAAQVLTLKDAISLLANRARLIEETCSLGNSGMIAVKMSADRLRLLLSSEDGMCSQTVSVACDNSPNDCVLSVPVWEIEPLLQFLGGRNIKCKRLDVPFGFHSPLMEPLRQDFNQVASKIRLREPAVPLGLALTGKMYTPGAIDYSYFSSQTISSVRFREVIQSYAASVEETSHVVFLEVGTHPTLLPMIKASMMPFPHHATYLHSLHRSNENWRSLADSAAGLALQGIHIRWREGFAGQSVKLVDFPSYPFARSEYRIPSRPSRVPGSSVATAGILLAPGEDSLVSARPHQSSNPAALYDVSPTISSLVDGHRVAGFQLCPASVYIELALQAVTQARGTRDQLCLRNITFPAPLVSHEDKPLQPIEVRLEAICVEGDETNFYISPKSVLPSNAIPATFSHGTVFTRRSGSLPTPRQVEPGGFLGASSVIQRRMLYETIFTRVVSYSSLYQTIDWLQINNGGKAARGSFRLRQDALQKSYNHQPVFLDTLLHAAGFIANCSVPSAEVCICTSIEYVDVLAPRSNWSESFDLHTQISSNQSGFSGISHAFDNEGNLVAVVEGIHFRRLPLASFQKSLQFTSSKAVHPRASVPKTGPDLEHQLVRDTPDNPHSIIIRILQQLTGVSKINLLETSTFPDLGIDSLMMIELSDKLRDEFPDLEPVSESALSECTTLSSLETLVSRNYNMSADNPDPTVDFLECSSDDDKDRSESSLSLADDESAMATSVIPSKCASPRPQMLALNSNIADTIVHVIAEVIGLSGSQINPNSTLGHLGLDSLMAIELGEKLRTEKICELDLLGLDSCRTVADVVALIETRRKLETDTSHPTTDTPRLLRTGLVTATPLYLVHDGSGISNMYSRLGELNRSVYGISAPSSRAFQTLAEMASSYVTMLDPTRPMILGGWSFGGVVAFEMAHIIQNQNPKTVKGVILIDSPCPTHHEGLPSQIQDEICRGKPGWMLDNFKMHTALLSQHQPTARSSDIPVVYLQSKDVFDAFALCEVNCAFLDNAKARAEEVRGWEELVGRPIHTLAIPGNHFQCFESDIVGETSDKILKAIKLLEDEAV